jgi:hypothetical protein
MSEYEIVERVKDWYRTASIKAYYNFLLNDITVISKKSYKRSYEYDPYISKQVIGYVDNGRTGFVFTLEFPTLTIDWSIIPYAYLYKKGYVIRAISSFGPAPLPNLKYIIYCITGSTGYEFQDKLVIELVDLDVAANNLNLPKIISSVLGSKLFSENKIIEYGEFYEIQKQMRSQKLFAGHTWNDAQDIAYRYFDKNERDLSKEVFKISEAYERVFRPYRVVYNTKTWQPVLV